MLLWGKEDSYTKERFKGEPELEKAILEVSTALFGENRIYLDKKKKIGGKGKKKNIPDGYLIDLSSAKEPKLYLVENEKEEHDSIKHIAIQILEFSLSFDASQVLVKKIVKEALFENDKALAKCQKYVDKNGYENIDFLLETIIYGEDKFNALVIIDELSDELEKVLISSFQFPVEILTIEKYCSKSGERLFRFEPFLSDITQSSIDSDTPTLDPSDIDTIVVPAKDEGFESVFLGENRWHSIRIHSSMIPKIKYIAAYRVAPESAITHIAPVASIDQWKDSNKYVVNFATEAKKIKAVKLVPKSKVKAPQAPRYTSKKRIEAAKNLDEAF